MVVWFLSVHGIKLSYLSHFLVVPISFKQITLIWAEMNFIWIKVTITCLCIPIPGCTFCLSRCSVARFACKRTFSFVSGTFTSCCKSCFSDGWVIGARTISSPENKRISFCTIGFELQTILSLGCFSTEFSKVWRNEMFVSFWNLMSLTAWVLKNEPTKIQVTFEILQQKEFCFYKKLIGFESLKKQIFFNLFSKQKLERWKQRKNIIILIFDRKMVPE